MKYLLSILCLVNASCSSAAFSAPALQEEFAEGKTTFGFQTDLEQMVTLTAGFFVTDSIELNGGYRDSSYAGTENYTENYTDFDTGLLAERTESNEIYFASDLWQFGLRYFPGSSPSFFKLYVGAKYGLNYDDDDPKSGAYKALEGDSLDMQLGSYMGIAKGLFFDFGINIPIMAQTPRQLTGAADDIGDWESKFSDGIAPSLYYGISYIF
jgi:hypothetical protein